MSFADLPEPPCCVVTFAAQRLGRKKGYVRYHVRIGHVERAYGFQRP